MPAHSIIATLSLQGFIGGNTGLKLIQLNQEYLFPYLDKKCLYGRHNSLKMGRMPATPDEGYHDPHPSAERQWFRNKTQWEVHNEREKRLQDKYLKKKGLK